MYTIFDGEALSNGRIHVTKNHMKGKDYMSQLTDIIKMAEQGGDSTQLVGLLKELKSKEAMRKKFGLVYDHHLPEVFEVNEHNIKKGDIVVLRSARGEFEPNGHKRHIVEKVYEKDGVKVADLFSPEDDENVSEVELDSLIKTVAQNEVVYPGLVADGEVIGDEDSDTYHSVVRAENYDALRMLGGTDMVGKIDCIYIDPPYNTGSKDWIYNNDYVDGSDEFRSAAFMNFLKRRIQEAKTLLNPEDSVLILTIDEKECLNVGKLLHEVFSGARIQMVSSVINPAGAARESEFYRTDEYIFIVQLGDSSPVKLPLGSDWSLGKNGKSPVTKVQKIRWDTLRRTGPGNLREDSPGCFYPLYIADSGKIIKIGDAVPLGTDRKAVDEIKGATTVFPIFGDNNEGRWRQGPENARKLLKEGYLKVSKKPDGGFALYYLARGERMKVKNDVFPILGYEKVNNTIIVGSSDEKRAFIPGTQWFIASHNATAHGSRVINDFHGEKRFDYPKSLYAVEDVIRFFVADKPHATILDFFGGSGTTAHAVMHLNEQDGGKRKSITVTNNEIGVQRSKKLSKQGYQSGDPEWEKYGVYEYATKPRITAAITGKTASSGYTEDIKGYYKYNDFQDEYAIGDPIPKDKARQFKDGLKQNVKFFKLNYLSYRDIFLDMVDDSLYPLLWLEQGQTGDIPQDVNKYFISDTYAVVRKLSKFDKALKECGDNVKTVYVHTDKDTAAQLQKNCGQTVDVVPVWDLYMKKMKSKTIK